MAQLVDPQVISDYSNPYQVLPGSPKNTPKKKNTLLRFLFSVIYFFFVQVTPLPIPDDESQGSTSSRRGSSGNGAPPLPPLDYNPPIPPRPDSTPIPHGFTSASGQPPLIPNRPSDAPSTGSRSPRATPSNPPPSIHHRPEGGNSLLSAIPHGFTSSASGQPPLIPIRPSDAPSTGSRSPRDLPTIPSKPTGFSDSVASSQPPLIPIRPPNDTPILQSSAPPSSSGDPVRTNPVPPRPGSDPTGMTTTPPVLSTPQQVSSIPHDSISLKPYQNI